MSTRHLSNSFLTCPARSCRIGRFLLLPVVVIVWLGVFYLATR